MNDDKSKVRLDKAMVDRGLTTSRERSRALILSGEVLVNGIRVDKAGHLVKKEAAISIKGEENPYVSRGGLKLKHALTRFQIHVDGLIAIDVGASTGGFSDCLLKEGAKKVYAIDVGYGQLAWKLRTDERVVVFERTNIRYFDGTCINEPIDIATIDVSFISLRLVLPVVHSLMTKHSLLLALVKPQFEAERNEIGKGGVVKSSGVHARVVNEIVEISKETGFKVVGTCESPLLGPAGNKEFFIFAVKEGNFRNHNEKSVLAKQID
ncbi:MAG: TlyA family RNA methyltransferase [Syntrophales bacterium]|jgi:23S rRNA (cytidine1920-2'-O)/16S rRNA (cytidine1409-2'-O)-methyltransferase|nr:TlyA family RNA methyltransferase [Syntrophales bacterium]MDY0043379.1 TlyA family RNA methyltransferase [Syntrophales bacterium]